MSIYDLNAYEVLQTEDLSDLKSKGTLMKHKKSGARVLLMENDDENKVFTIGFRTPPSDSTGVPHIMEHSVLCGSKEFPVKDPFVELVKGSLNPPVHSQNLTNTSRQAILISLPYSYHHTGKYSC